MTARLRARNEWLVMVSGFGIGLVIAGVLFGLYLLLSGGSQEAVQLSAPATSRGGGLIAQTYNSIARRVDAERAVIRPVRGNLFFRASNVIWTDPGHPDFVNARELHGQLDNRALASGNVIVHGLSIAGGDVYVEQNTRQEWNYRRVLAPFFEPSLPGAPERTFTVTDVALRAVNVRVKTPVRAFEFRAVAALLPVVEFAAPHLPAPRITVARATGTLVTADSSYAIAAEDARLLFPAGRVDFNVARIITGQTRIGSLVGTWSSELPGYGLRATGQVENLRFQDVRFVSKRIPREGTAAFAFVLEPISNTLTRVGISDARLESQGSHVSGSATVALGDSTLAVEAIDARFDPLALSLVEQLLGDTLPYKGTISGTARGTGGLVTFDLSARLRTTEVPNPFTTKLTGTARLASSGVEIRRLEVNLREAPLAALRALAPGLPLKGTVNGAITVNGPPGKSPLNLNVRVELANGVAIVEGKLDLTGAVPSYDLSGRLLAINVQQLVEPPVPPVFMTAHFSAVGSGFDPNTANARLHLEGRFTGWRASPHDTIHIAARLQQGSLLVDSAAVKLATMTASANGNWRFAVPAAGSIEYRVAFDPITPFGPYVPAIGNDNASGSIAAAGRVFGERGNIQLSGDANAHALAIGGWAAGALTGKYQVVIGPAIPQFVFTADARDLRTPTAGTYQTATANVRLQSPAFALEVHANRAGGNGGIEIVADGRIPPTGAREVVLHRARIDLGNDNWSLTAPAVFSWAAPGSDLTVRGFEMRKSSGNGLVRLDGRVFPLNNANFALNTIALPVGDLQRLLGREARVSGALTTNTTIQTVQGAPRLNLTFQLDSAVVEGVRFSQLSGDAAYADQKFTGNATAIADTAGALRVHAELPLELRLGASASARLLETGAVRVTLVSDSIALAPFATLSPNLEKLSGALAANVTVTGTVQDPLLAGTLALRNGAMRVIPINQRFDSINAVVGFENRTATIQQLRARAGGTVNASGRIEFRDLTKPMLDLTAVLTRFQPVGVDNQPDAQISGEVHLGGPMRAAVLTGRLTMADGYFPVPQVGGNAMAQDVADFEDVDVSSQPPAPSMFENVSINGLQLNIGPNLWFIMPDARAELAGSLTVDKHGKDVRIVGDLEGERGTYVLRAGPIIRRFDVTHAFVRFLGGTEINPAIDITAQRIVVDASGRELNIEVRVGGTLQSPTLALASEDAAAIPQSELLSFLLFGQPSFALGGGRLLPGQQVLEQTVVGGLSELASIELEQSLLDQLGMSFDIFQIRLGGGRLNELSPSLVVGRELGSNVFLTVETAVNTLFGGNEPTVATFAVHLEWRINENTTVRTSWEPANKASVLRGYTVALPAVLRPQQQYQGTLELRRRWTWSR